MRDLVRRASGGAVAWAPRRWPLLASLSALNFADAAATHGLLTAGLATEANPLMRAAWSLSPWVFLAVKLAMVNAGAWFLYRNRAAAAAIALILCLAVYAAINAYHLVILGTTVLSLGSAFP